MNRIVLQFGFLIFAISVIYFSSLNLAVEDILLRSVIIFLAFTLLTSLIALLFVKSINKVSFDKNKDTNLNYK